MPKPACRILLFERNLQGLPSLLPQRPIAGALITEHAPHDAQSALKIVHLSTIEEPCDQSQFPYRAVISVGFGLRVATFSRTMRARFFNWRRSRFISARISRFPDKVGFAFVHFSRLAFCLSRFAARRQALRCRIDGFLLRLEGGSK